jgi:hypothetical protein
VVNAKGEIYERTRSGWSLRSGCAKDIGVGYDGSVWVIGCNSVEGGYGIHRYRKATNDWESFPGGGIRISALNEISGSVVNSWGAFFTTKPF